jgi:rhodanese-related sulfurtransferase
MRRISAATLRGLLVDQHELALLDAREEGEFGAGHLFWAVPCPLSRREIRARALLPRLGTRIVCVDDGSGLAERLAAWLESIGATDVAVLDGGTRAWEAAGQVLFSGVNVPSKAFGEWVERHFGTESVAPADLEAWLEAGRDLAVLDSRTYDEFRAGTIPTAVNVPGGELLYRIADLVEDPATPIVVTCAGRTRAILGAESLRRTGVPNRVLALRNGTMGWELAGFRPERGRAQRFAPGRPRHAELALQRAKAFAEASGAGEIAAVTCWMCATRPSSPPATGRAASRLPAASWCRRPTIGLPSATPASPWWTTMGCGRGWRRPGCGRWAIATCSSSRTGSPTSSFRAPRRSACRNCTPGWRRSPPTRWPRRPTPR